MKFGAYLGDSNALGWVTPDVTPMHFFRKMSSNISFGGSTTSIRVGLNVSSSELIIPFVQFSNPSYAPYSVMQAENGVWTILVQSGFSYSTTISVYIFKIVIPQPLPKSKYGIAIFDATGNCILTNESNPLRILEEITLRGVSGVGISAQTKTYQNKSIAVFPRGTGNVVGRINPPSGPPILRPSFKSYVALRSGSNTLLSPTGTDAAAGTPSSFYAPYVKTYVIDTSIYD